ncbi:MAG: MOSC domain-containing protein [Blastocatellia bacterium]
MQIISIQVGLPQTHTDKTGIGSADSVWTTAYSKQPVSGAVWFGKTELAGDGHANMQNHGGPEKAGCIYPVENYEFWRQEAGLLELAVGAFAENFTTEGLIEDQVCVGDTYSFGEVVVQVSQPRGPCWKVCRWLGVSDLATKMEQTGRTGWYVRVLKEGNIEAGARIELIERPFPEWNIMLANQMAYGSGVPVEKMKEFAACPLLAESWRTRVLTKIAALERQ